MDIIADETWFACEIITSVTGALVYYGTTTALADYTAGYAIPFNSETYDTGNFHSTSSNTERFTVAGGASKVRVSAGVELLSVTGNTTTVRLRKNGAAFVGAPGHCASNAGGGPYYNVVSAVVNVQSGDYFDVYLTTADVSAQIVQTATWFAIEVVAA